MSENAGIASPRWSLRTKRTVALILLLVLFVFTWRLGDMWPPLIVSLVLAYLLNPGVSFFDRYLPVRNANIRRMLATVLTFFLAVGLVVLVLVILVPAIVAQLRQFGDGIPTLAAQINDALEQVLSTRFTIGGQTIVPLDVLRDQLGVEPEMPLDIHALIGTVDVASAVQSFLGPLTSPVLGALGTAVSGIVSMIFVLTMVFYLMKDGPQFLDYIEALAPPSYRADIRYLLHGLGGVWNAYLRGQIVLSLIMGVVVFFSATLLGVRSPLVLGLLSGLLEFIPNLGPALALLPAALFALFFPSTTIPGLQGLVFMLVVIVVWTGLQNLEAIFLVPRIMGGSLDLHPFIVIVAVIGGATLAGALGVILAAPVTASLRVLGEYLYVKLLDDIPPDLRRRTLQHAVAQARSRQLASVESGGSVTAGQSVHEEPMS